MENGNNLPVLTWERPETAEYPKIWYTFKARDLNSDDLVEYRIQDLPLERVGDLYEHLNATFIPDEPTTRAFGYQNDPHIQDDYKRLWEPLVEQRTVLVCFKEGSDEIVGTNVVYIVTAKDNFFKDIRKEMKGHVVKLLIDMVGVLYENYDTFEAHKVDKYMSSLGLSVDRNYRGRGIGDHFLTSRKAMCRAFGVTLTQTSFTSDFSNANADKAGYKTDVALNYSDIIADVRKYPNFAKLANIKSKQLTLKSLTI